MSGDIQTGGKVHISQSEGNSPLEQCTKGIFKAVLDVLPDLQGSSLDSAMQARLNVKMAPSGLESILRRHLLLLCGACSAPATWNQSPIAAEPGKQQDQCTLCSKSRSPQPNLDCLQELEEGELPG